MKTECQFLMQIIKLKGNKFTEAAATVLSLFVVLALN